MRIATVTALALLLPLSGCEPGGAQQPANAAAAKSPAPSAARPSPAEAIALAQQGALLLDVRSDQEWQAGHAKGAQWLPVSQVSAEASRLLPDKHASIITYCAVGARAERAAEALRAQGYTRVLAMSEGFEQLAALGHAQTPSLAPAASTTPQP